MGASESVIVYQEDVKLKYDAGEISVPDKCEHVKCSPNIENFSNNDKEKLILIIIILLFISLLFIKKT